MKASRGLTTLYSNWDSWNEIMSDSEASITDIVKIMPSLNKAMADILDLDLSDIEKLPANFMQQNWPLIEEVMNGVDGAMEKL
jgi:hypothetical protein